MKICAVCQRNIHYDAMLGWTHTYTNSRRCVTDNNGKGTAWPMSAGRMKELGLDFNNEYKEDTNA